MRIDHAAALFGTYRNLIASWDLDVAFISIRTPDSYVHYHYAKPEDAERTYRQELLAQIDQELSSLARVEAVLLLEIPARSDGRSLLFSLGGGIGISHSCVVIESRRL